MSAEVKVDKGERVGSIQMRFTSFLLRQDTRDVHAAIVQWEL